MYRKWGNGQINEIKKVNFLYSNLNISIFLFSIIVYYDKRNQFKIILLSNNLLAFPIENVKPRVKQKVVLTLCI